MPTNNNSIYNTLVAILPKSLKSLAIRFDKSPLTTVEQMTEFVRTRSSYIAQTSLYGYLKTRMGTKFQHYFTDDVFSQAIRISAIKVFASCLSDFTIHAVAKVAAENRLSPREAATLARHCYGEGLRLTLPEDDFRHLPGDADRLFRERAEATLWANVVLDDAVFAGSAKDLVRFAPVVDEFKKLDGHIVSNSIRFRWTDVRDQLARRLDPEAIVADWRDAAPKRAEAPSPR